MRRELLSLRSGSTLGAVVVEGKIRTFEGQAGNILSGLRRQVGDNTAVDLVMAEGWSNGYLYFGEVVS